MSQGKIKLYDPHRFIAAFMPSSELNEALHGDIGKFYIIRVEDMYRHVKHAVPASRTTMHICLYITEGEANMKIGSEQYTIQKNQMLLVPAGQVFSFHERDVNKGFICSFHDDILIGKFGKSDLMKDFEFLRIWGNPKISLDQQTSQFALNIFERLLIDYSQNGLNNLDIIQPYLTALLCEINSAYQPLSKSTQIASIGITNKFKELIYKSIKSTNQVADYAAMLNISPNHLNKTVKSITGKSPGKWIDETIVLEAKVLLNQSNFSISEIAAEVGIHDQSYFTRLFRKYEGITPTEFRKMIEKY